MSNILVNPTGFDGQQPPSQLPAGPEQVQLSSRVSLSPQKKQQLLSKLTENFNKNASARVNFERDWYYNLAFYFGRQWVEWVGTQSNNLDYYRLYEPPAPRWRVRLVSNKIRPIIRKELTKLTKEKMQYVVIPESTEDSDIMSARAAEQISEYLFTDLKFNSIRRRATFWSILCGTAFLKNYYVPGKSDSQGNLGSIVCEPVTAFHLFVPHLQEEDLENQPYVTHASAKDEQWVNDTYGSSLGGSSTVLGPQLEQKLFTALGLASAGAAKYVYVKETWIKPNKQFPSGALVTWTGEDILSFVDAWPFKFPEYPFAKIDHISTGRFYGDSVIRDLIPLQKEYNRTRSQLVEAKNRMARPQLIAPKGSIDPQKITSEPGLIIQYQPGFQPPQPLKLQDIPQYVINELERTQRDMDDIAGQYEVSKGRTPPGVEAASAIAYLQEENDSILFPTISSIEEAVEKSGHQWLVMVNQFWDSQHKIKVAGTNLMFETFMFSNADIAGSTDFRVEAQSSAPRSKAAKQAFITELGKLGWLTPDKVLRYLDMSETNKLYEETQLSARQAQRENIKMSMSGQISPVNEWDDPIVHIAEHENYMRSESFETLVPQIQQVLLQHLMMHKQNAYAAQPGLNQASPPPVGEIPGAPPQEMQPPPVEQPPQAGM